MTALSSSARTETARCGESLIAAAHRTRACWARSRWPREKLPQPGPMDSAAHDEANHRSPRPPGRSERGKPCSPPPLFRLLLPPSALDCLRELFVLFRHLREAVLPQAFRPSPVTASPNGRERVTDS